MSETAQIPNQNEKPALERIHTVVKLSKENLDTFVSIQRRTGLSTGELMKLAAAKYCEDYRKGNIIL